MRGVLPSIGLAAALAVAAPSGAALGQVPGADVWTYNPRALSAYVAPGDGLALTLACDVDALRIYMISEPARGEDGDGAIVTARLGVGETMREVRLRRNGRYFSSVASIREDAPLVAAMAGAETVSVTIDGTDAGTFPLAGAGPALRGLVGDCG